MADILASINTRTTPQGRKARADQVKNNAGGYAFQIGDEERLWRFLTLGTDSNSYYQKASELTVANAEVVMRMAANRPHELIDAIVRVSTEGRAPKNKQAVFALAIACAPTINTDLEARQRARSVLPQVARTFTHLAEFNKYVEQFQGRGRGINTAIAKWYRDKPVDKLAYQVTKYRAREGWATRDPMRLVKHKLGRSAEVSSDRDRLYAWAARRVVPEGGFTDESLAIVQDFIELQELGHAEKIDKRAVVDIIDRGHGVTWEHLPDAATLIPEVWDALLDQGMPVTALYRNLPKMTNVYGGTGLWVQKVVAGLSDAAALKRGRVHPVNLLVAQRTYAHGRSIRGDNTWTPIGDITNALDQAFYLAYDAVEPINGRLLLALDISASMNTPLLDYDSRGRVYRMPITAREVTGALALVLKARQAAGSVEVVGFSSSGGGYGGARRFMGYAQNWQGLMVPQYTYVPSSRPADDGLITLDNEVDSRRRLDDVLKSIAGLPHGGTDCALPFTWATKHNKDFDAVVVLTDNESWAGPIHAFQAAQQYRSKVQHDVKFIAAAMTATNYSVVDPKDSSGLNISGFDSAVPTLISDFCAGRV